MKKNLELFSNVAKLAEQAGRVRARQIDDWFCGVLKKLFPEQPADQLPCLDNEIFQRYWAERLADAGYYVTIDHTPDPERIGQVVTYRVWKRDGIGGEFDALIDGCKFYTEFNLDV